jgi:hypothetical protein
LSFQLHNPIMVVADDNRPVDSGPKDQKFDPLLRFESDPEDFTNQGLLVGSTPYLHISGGPESPHKAVCSPEGVPWRQLCEG